MDNAFKDMLANDLKNVFMNPDEFAELHTLDGIEMVVVDLNKNGEYKKTEELRNFQNGIYQKMITIMYEGEESELPRVGYQMNFDGFEYDVTSASFENGMHILNLVRNEG